MAKIKGLGRGLDALLAGDIGSVASADSLMMLRVTQLRPGKYQPRSHMDEAALQTLASSIKTQGIMQPILVRHLSSYGDEDQYEIIAGERRWRASQLAGLTEVPVLVREIEDEAALAMALIENIQRENLNALEEALGIQRLIDEFAMTHEKAAEAVGRSRVAVSNLLRLLSLCEPVQNLLIQNKLDMGHARALIGLDNATQVMLANQIVTQQLSVRDAEALVKKASLGNVSECSHTSKLMPNKPAKDRDVLHLQNQLSDKLGANVQIQSKANGAGTLKIQYANLDQLDAIIAILEAKT
jgi:ParB family transcriptional regulator, chromosome partitioning protein